MDLFIVVLIYYHYLFFNTDFYPRNKWIISNHTVMSDIQCALFCSRLDNCFGFGYRSGTVKKEDGINCQLAKCPKQDHIHEHHPGGSWTFFQPINLVSCHVRRLFLLRSLSARCHFFFCKWFFAIPKLHLGGSRVLATQFIACK